MGIDDRDIDEFFNRLKRRPKVVSGPKKRRRYVLVGVIVLVILLLSSIGWMAETYMQYLFLSSVHHTAVFWVPILWQWGLFVAGFAVMLAIAYPASRMWKTVGSAVDTRIARHGGKIRWATLVVMSAIVGLNTSSVWQDIVLYVHQHPFPAKDPYFHLNDAFFVFTLPVINDVVGLLWLIFGLLVFGLAAVALFHGFATSNPAALPFKLQPVKGENPKRERLLMIRQMADLLAAFFLLASAGAVIGIYEMAYNQQTDFVGLDATDRAIGVPMLVTCAVIALAFALLAVALRLTLTDPSKGPRALRLSGASVVVWLVLAGFLQFVPEGIYSTIVVNPNAQQLQTAPIAAYLTSSRAGWGLEPGTDVINRAMNTVHAPTLSDLTSDPGTLQNVRILDPSELPDVLNQTERSRSYQTFPSVTVDRYPLSDGTEIEVMLAPRELAEQDLPNSSFVNENLHYTNGYGVVAASVNQTGAEGKPVELVGNQPQAPNPDVSSSDIPPALDFDGNPNADPRIFCGIDTTQPVVVNTKEPEFEYPSGSGEQDVANAGPGMVGIPISNPITKIAASITEFGNSNLFFTDQLTSQSELLIDRQIQTRVQQTAPFLTLDSDPYVVVDPETGNLMYIIDAYVESPNFPESEVVNGVSYMRNAVKVVIDARSCAMTLYAVNPEEPMTATYSSIYPGLFKPLSSMPLFLKQHLRYPQDLFNDQVQVYDDVHVSSPAVFYNHADFYTPSQETVNNQQQATTPNYVEMTLPGTKTNQFVLLQTFAPANNGSGGQSNNMTAMLAATCDYVDSPDPKLVSIPLNNAVNVLGPLQFDYNINTNQTISEQLTLLGQHGSQVILGNVIVLPFNDDSFLYVRPLYVLASNSSGGGSFPELEQVIVGTQNSVVMAPTFEQALQSLYSTTAAIPGLGNPEQSTSPQTSPTPTPTVSPGPTASPSPTQTATGENLDPQEESVLNDLLKYEQLANQAFSQGNYTAWGQDEAKVQSDAAELQKLLQQGGSA